MKRTIQFQLKACAVALMLSAFLFFLARAGAQSTFGSVRGTTADPTGASIPATSIVLHSVEENTDNTGASDQTGGIRLRKHQAGPVHPPRIP